MASESEEHQEICQRTFGIPRHLRRSCRNPMINGMLCCDIMLNFFPAHKHPSLGQKLSALSHRPPLTHSSRAFDSLRFVSQNLCQPLSFLPALLFPHGVPIRK